MGPADSHGISRVPRYSGCCQASTISRIRDSHPLRFSFPEDSALLPSCLYGSPTTPYLPEHIRFGLLRVRSPLLAQSLLFSFPAGTEMFQFPAFAFPCGNTTCVVGYPIRTSRIHAVICTSPGLFAACHVLLRLQEPQASTACPLFPVLLFKYGLRINYYE